MTDLPRGWAATTLDQIANWSSGGTPSRKRPEFFGGGIPWVKTGELTAKYVQETEETLTELGVKNSSAKVFPAGSVGIAMYGATIGKVSIWGIDASTNQACAVAQPLSGVVSSEFLYHFLRSEKAALVKEGKGGAQPNISQGLLKEWPIILPPHNEQRRIVEKIEAMFDEIDAGIQSLHTARTTLGLYRQSLLKSAFEGRLTADWRTRNADRLEAPETLLARIQHERDTRYKTALDTWQDALATWRAAGEKGKKPTKPKRAETIELSDAKREQVHLAPEWIVDTLGNHVEFLTSGSRGWANFYASIGATFIRAQNLKHDRLDLQDIAYVKLPKGNSEGMRTRVQRGDILITITGANVTKTAVVLESFEEAYVSQHVALCRLSTSILPKFAWRFLIADACGRKQLENAAYGAGKPGLNLPNILEVAIPICSTAEQAEIVRILDEKLEAAGALEAEIDAALARADVLRQSILKKAFSGQLVPQDPNDEPAATLLARIKAEPAKAITGSRKGRSPNSETGSRRVSH